MEEKDCIMYARVCKISDQTPFLRGRIAGVPQPQTSGGAIIIVEWDGATDWPRKEYIKLLVPEEEGLRQEARLHSIEVQLEQEFERLRATIAIKLQEAADLVKEAGRMAAASNHDLYDLSGECRPILNALKDHGWSSSSMSC